jgi:putative ABC transport system permease protein
MRNKKVGYDKEQLMYLPLRGETQKSYGVLKKELLAANIVKGVSGTMQPPTFMSANGGGAEWDGKDPNFDPLIGFGVVDFDYVETMKIEMAEGRSFSEKFSTDTSKSVLVNEEVVKLMGTQSAVGKRFDFAVLGVIIGVMKNYHYQSIQNNIEPLALYVSPNQVNYAILRLPAGDIPSSLERVKTVWQKVFPAYPFEYKFFDEDFARMFQTDERLSTLLKYAAVLAILIACLGLFGLASFMTEQRTKEIGIRKVLGATVSGITIMLSKEFVQWVIVANLIAGPVAYLLTTKFLQNYAYRISIGWWIFILSILITIAIAFLTISWQTIRAARTNPANSLKYE